LDECKAAFKCRRHSDEGLDLDDPKYWRLAVVCPRFLLLMAAFLAADCGYLYYTWVGMLVASSKRKFSKQIFTNIFLEKFDKFCEIQYL
jgi:hypothetical protein